MSWHKCGIALLALQDFTTQAQSMSHADRAPRCAAPAVQATWKRHQRMALAAQQAAAAAEMGDAEALGGLPHLTPTPETPITRLGKRSSLTPGALQPLSPRAAAAAAAAIEAAAAGGATSRHRQRAEREHEDWEAAGLPLSPRGHAARSHRGGSAAAWASAAAAVLAAAPRTSDAGEAPPQSPRQRGRAGRDRDDGPASPRHGTSKAAFAAGREEEGDSGDGQDACGRRRRQQQQQRAAAEGSDSEEQGANATGSDSQVRGVCVLEAGWGCSGGCCGGWSAARGGRYCHVLLFGAAALAFSWEVNVIPHSCSTANQQIV